jgi:hypothetical protein
MSIPVRLLYVLEWDVDPLPVLLSRGKYLPDSEYQLID